MVKVLKSFGILFLGLAIFVMNNYKIDGLQSLLEMMAFTLPSYLISFTAGVIILLATKSKITGSIIAMLMILFLQLGGLDSKQINVVSYFISGITLFLTIKVLGSCVNKIYVD